MRNRPAKDEPARFETDNLLDSQTGVGRPKLIHGDAKSAWMPEQSRDIAEHNSLVGKIRNGADIIFD